VPRIIFRSAAGVDKPVDVDDGYTVMEAAVDHEITGMVGECGGACACATCHIYVDEGWLARLPAMEDMEDAMLDAAMDRRDVSRLGCQVEMTTDLDGLVVTVADNDA